MGLIDWFKETKDGKEDLLKRISKAINKAKKGNSIDEAVINTLESLSLDDIQNILVPFYLDLSPDDRGFIRKWLIESGFTEKVKTISKAKDNEKKVKLLEIIRVLRINPGTSLLIELLSDKDEGVRWIVSDILKELLPRDGINLLIEKLKYPLKYPPSRIGEILVEYGDKALEALFTEVELEKDSSIKAIAVLGLMPLGKVYISLNNALSTKGPEIRLAALEALEEKEVKEYSDLPLNVITSINEAVNGLLKDTNPLIRIKAVNILSRLPLDNGEALYSASLDENNVVRTNALTGLKNKGVIVDYIIEKIKNDRNHPLNNKV